MSNHVERLVQTICLLVYFSLDRGECMPDVNFRESAIRHWNDSRTLSAVGELANVGQLLGFSAECGLKALYRCFFLSAHIDGDIDWNSLSKVDRTRYRVHIDKLCATVSSLPDSPALAKYISLIPSITNFTSWHADQRYWSDVDNAATCTASIPGWEIATREVLAMIAEAQKDGMSL